MLTLDLIQDAGGHAASFCELGALANAEGMQVALRVALADPQTRVVLVSLIGGLTRMDDIAEGIAAFLRAGQGVAPIVVRMAGTKEEEGRAILHALGIAAFDDLAATVREAVSLTKEGPCLSS
jgi:succinyl-CoA synthetase beta subunit